MGRRWFDLGKARNDHEAGSSGRAAGRAAPPPSQTPRATTPAARAAPPRRAAGPFQIAPPANGPDRRVRRRPYLNKAKCQWYWDNAIPVPWPDVHLPEDWHLNPERIPVPPVPKNGLARENEILRRHAELPPDLRRHPSFAMDSPHWDTWFTDEHDIRRRSFFGARRARGAPQFPPPSPPRPARRGRAQPPLRTGGPLRIGEAAPVKEEADEEEEEEEPPQWWEEDDEEELPEEPALTEEEAVARVVAESAREAEEAAAAEARAVAEAVAAVAAAQAAEEAEAAQARAEEAEAAQARAEAEAWAHDAPWPPAVAPWFEPLVGMSWQWTGPPPELPPAPAQPPTPPRASGLPAHLVEEPDYVILE